MGKILVLVHKKSHSAPVDGIYFADTENAILKDVFIDQTKLYLKVLGKHIYSRTRNQKHSSF